MTQHRHRAWQPWCFRCDLSRGEALGELRFFRLDVEIYATEQQLEAAMDRVMAALDDLSPSVGSTWLRVDEPTSEIRGEQ